jgi:hypothetical protein
MDCQRDQALPTALAPKISLDRNLVQEGFDRERGMRITRARWVLGRKRKKRPLPQLNDLVSGPRKDKQCNQISQFSASTLQRPAASAG